MGRMLGAFDNSDELDRPDLNKCPDCGCFFAQDECPLCGKLCPDDMRAGNRKAVRKKREKNSTGRVVFVEWYHSWWFIIIMLLSFSIVGFVLLFTSPHKKSKKIAVGAAAAIYFMISSFGIGNIVGRITGFFDHPVNTSLTREEYISSCTYIEPETYYRTSPELDGVFVSMEVVIIDRFVDVQAQYSGEKYTAYYKAKPEDNDSFDILLRDCVISGNQNLLPGDVVLIYGQGAGDVSVYDESYAVVDAPCVNMAYFEIKG